MATVVAETRFNIVLCLALGAYKLAGHWLAARFAEHGVVIVGMIALAARDMVWLCWFSRETFTNRRSHIADTITCAVSHVVKCILTHRCRFTCRVTHRRAHVCHIGHNTTDEHHGHASERQEGEWEAVERVGQHINHGSDDQ